MAKAAPVEIDAGMTFAEAALRTVRVRADELWEHSEGVLDTSDIERVHDMRVATRRLRAVLEIFAPCFPPKQHKKVLREVKALADALGARRDPDVQLEALAGREGIDAFVALLRDEQREGNERLAEALARTDRLRERLDRLVAA
ncbi:MAG: CHAD domain-containing protein [Actinomycetota bacterium]|nr:CHAD domain-containing protein [Actinomycetota bacterium]MDQ5808479.1 CHAD domain-containing protein [Actinomycetota bacterium]